MNGLLHSKLPLLVTLAPLVMAAAGACASFSGDDTPVDGGSSDAQSGGDDTSTAFLDASDASDASDAGDADPDAFPSTQLIPVTAGGASFAIESREVTVAQYDLFKTRFSPPLSFPTAQCPTKTQLGPPSGHCGSRFADEDPVTCVDWCDANAYCTAIGRHLCGDVSGGTLAQGKRNDPAFDEWYFACRGANGFTYPYGNDAGPVCATDLPGPVSVASKPGCVGAESGLFDMSGNVAEWVDSCLGGACLVRGGSYKYKASDATCGDQTITVIATNAYPDIGFRCCTEP